MLIEDLIIDISSKKNSLEVVNNYAIEEFAENYFSQKGDLGEMYKKVASLLQANASIIESIEHILTSYQEKLELQYEELLNSEI